jgi:hypothetical protein
MLRSNLLTAETLALTQEFGPTPPGRRRIIDIGGTLKGRGERAAGGADWQVIRSDGGGCSIRATRSRRTTARSSTCRTRLCAQPARRDAEPDEGRDGDRASITCERIAFLRPANSAYDWLKRRSASALARLPAAEVSSSEVK